MNKYLYESGNVLIGDVKKGLLLLVSALLVAAISACSSGAVAQPEASQIENPGGGMTSVGRPSGEVPKASSGESEQAPLAAAVRQDAPIGGGSQPESLPEAAPVEPEESEFMELFVAPTEDLSAPIESPTVLPTETPASLPAEPPAAPVIDNSIPEGPGIGYRAPEFTLQTLSGQTVQWSDLLGKPTLISYWATWCGPCMNELSILSKIHAEYQGQDFQVITINAIEQDSVDKVQSTVNQMGMTFPVLLDHGDQFAKMYQTLFLPTTFYVDANGVIRSITLGDSSEAEFRGKIKQLIAAEL